MEACLQDATKLGWIDGIMLTYNFRVMYTDAMKKAVDACVRSGIGLTAMKTQATGWGTSTHSLSPTEKDLLDRMQKGGFTPAQAKLKAVWSDDRMASICSYMANMSVLSANISAALDETALSNTDADLFRRYAMETASNYCAGCASNCEPMLHPHIPVSDIMRFLMYRRCYCDDERASAAFDELPESIRSTMARADYSEAEQRCPQGMPIGRLMREAVSELA
jgi:predicted aldo/keto reductase-like oxidoreductase